MIHFMLVRWKIPFFALLLVLFQLVLVMSISEKPDLQTAYRALCHWDCGWYSDIAQNGYHSTIPPMSQNAKQSNVAFFPGYPFFSRVFSYFLQMDTQLGLLIAAQISCGFFWVFFIFILKKWNVSQMTIVLCILAVLVHPASFYLVAGYSESLFLASFLGMVYFSYENKKYSQICACLFGFVVTATRIIGIPLVIFPMLTRFFCHKTSGKCKSYFLQSLFMACVSMLGAGFFFLFCKIQFDDLSLYMETQQIGWGVIPDYLIIFNYMKVHMISEWDGWSTHLSYFSFLLMAVFEIFFRFFEQKSKWLIRLPLYYSALIAFYLTISGLASAGMRSMIRYTLVWFVIEVLCLAHITTLLPAVTSRLRYAIYLTLGLCLLAVFYYYQRPHLHDFLNGRWFA